MTIDFVFTQFRADTPLPNDRPVSLVTGHHQPIRGQDSDQTDQSEARSTEDPSLPRSGYCLMSSETDQDASSEIVMIL